MWTTLHMQLIIVACTSQLKQQCIQGVYLPWGTLPMQWCPALEDQQQTPPWELKLEVLPAQSGASSGSLLLNPWHLHDIDRPWKMALPKPGNSKPAHVHKPSLLQSC